MRAALVLDAPVGEPAKLLNPCGQPVARSLELAQAQQTRPNDRLRHRGGRRDVGKAIGDDRRELTLEPCDLLAQRAPRRALARLRTTILNGPAGVAIDE